MIEDKLISEILDCWNDDQNHPHRNRTKRDIPKLQDIKELVELAFFTSLLREEDKAIYSSLVLAARDDVNESLLNRKTEIYCLEEPLPATPGSIAKISPALDPTYSSLLIERSSIGAFVCWGVTRFDPALNTFTSLPISRIDGNSLKLDLFTVTIRSPGSLLISRAESEIGRFSNGVFTPACPTPFISHSLGKYLIEMIESTDLTKKYQSAHWHYFSRVLEELLYESSKRGHGSTIIILPQTYTSDTWNMIDFKHKFSPRPSFSTFIEDAIKGLNFDITWGISVRKSIYELIQFIAQLSTVDGALVLNRDFEIMGFGATLKAPLWEGTVIEGADGFGRRNNKLFEHRKYGTRHNSAINFSGACKGAVSFVISQDGPIRAFLSTDSEKVQCWPDCTVSMFV